MLVVERLFVVVEYWVLSGLFGANCNFSIGFLSFYAESVCFQIWRHRAL